eukprot:scaffold19017_cov69-Phaeocystis_antarctica.AAC.4
MRCITCEKWSCPVRKNGTVLRTASVPAAANPATEAPSAIVRARSFRVHGGGRGLGRAVTWYVPHQAIEHHEAEGDVLIPQVDEADERVQDDAQDHPPPLAQHVHVSPKVQQGQPAKTGCCWDAAERHGREGIDREQRRWHGKIDHAVCGDEAEQPRVAQHGQVVLNHRTAASSVMLWGASRRHSSTTPTLFRSQTGTGVIAHFWSGRRDTTSCCFLWCCVTAQQSELV